MDNTRPLDTSIHYTLRFAAAMCFLGHGAFGIITKPVWCNYFAVFGIGHHMAYNLMPVVGTVDILMGITLLLYPTRAILLWLVIWGTTTALCRPLSGEPFAEFLERAGNYGVPLALLILSGYNAGKPKYWIGAISPDIPVNKKALALARNCLRAVVFLLLAGHGLLNIMEKKALLEQYAALGFHSPVPVAHIVGLLEITAALSVLVRPARPVIMAFLLWKMGTELFYPHWEAFEWIERGGSYGAVLALYLLLPPFRARSESTTIAIKQMINQQNQP